VIGVADYIKPIRHSLLRLRLMHMHLEECLRCVDRYDSSYNAPWDISSMARDTLSARRQSVQFLLADEQSRSRNELMKDVGGPYIGR
jgi:hypothetical protein